MMYPAYVPKYTISPDVLFETLLEEINWIERTPARKEYFMSDIDLDYTYGSGRGVRTYSSAPLNDTVRKLMAELNKTTGSDYNVCFLNYYETQKNHLGWHSDDSIEMDNDHPIAVLSLGVAREIWWKPKEHKGEIPNEWKQLLASGSLFVMPLGFQDKYYHKIPKHWGECGGRISLTFRRYKL